MPSEQSVAAVVTLSVLTASVLAYYLLTECAPSFVVLLCMRDLPRKQRAGLGSRGGGALLGNEVLSPAAGSIESPSVLGALPGKYGSMDSPQVQRMV